MSCTESERKVRKEPIVSIFYTITTYNEEWSTILEN